MNHRRSFKPLLCLACCLTTVLMFTPINAEDSAKPMASESLVFAEHDGLVAVEAEHFVRQELSSVRAFHVTTSKAAPLIEPDGDPSHVAGAAGGAYVEVLPDSRRNHSEKLISGENFSNEPGKLAVLTYRVHFQTPGKYYVWVRAFSSGSEDNGLHVGIDGTWPDSGKRLQWCDGKKTWRWESKQRTEEKHCGEPHKIFLEVPSAGIHEIHFSMREDGFEIDRWLMTTNREFERPEGIGPKSSVHAGTAPEEFTFVEAPPVVAETAQNSPMPDPIGKSKQASKSKSGSDLPLQLPRQPDGNGSVEITGEVKQWHKVTLTLDGPYAHELDNSPNPFVNYEMKVTFTHESGSPAYVVPAYFAADGNAGETSAQNGTKWRAHLSPDKTGSWNYSVSFKQGKNVAIDGGGEALKPFDGVSGTFKIAENDKTGRDFRAHGRLQYVGKHYLQFAGSKEYFLKAGPDSPETLLASSDFDNTSTEKSDKGPLKTWSPHAGDWKSGDPTWRDGKGKNLIGALNYLASKGVNAFSFLTYNAAGDGDNVWPFVERDAKLHYDCSKLDQWGIVFDHSTMLGLYLHFKLQENESDDERLGMDRKQGRRPEALDGGKLGVERKLYCRELIARFGHALALNWNIGEENTQSTEEVQDMVKYLHDNDPYRHHIVLHTFPPEMDAVYRPLLGDKSLLTGVSMQTGWKQSHKKTLQWRAESAATGRAWVVAHDEQNPASLGVPPDPGYKGHNGIAEDKNPKGKAEEGFVASAGYTMHDIRKQCLWGTLMAGGAGVEYYFGYQLPENDLNCEDFRSRDKSWDYCRIALNFCRDEKIPFTEMSTANALIGNTKDDNSKFCFAKTGELYLVYLPTGGTAELDLSGATGAFTVKWFNPRTGGELAVGSVNSIQGGSTGALGNPPVDPTEDWMVVVRK